MKKNASNKNYTNPHIVSLKHQNILNITTAFINNPLTLKQFSLKSISPSYRKRCGSKPENAYARISSPKGVKDRASHRPPEVQTYKIESKIPISMTDRNSHKALKSSKLMNNGVKFVASEIKKTIKNRKTPIKQVKKMVLSKLDSPTKDISKSFKCIPSSPRKIIEKLSLGLYSPSSKSFRYNQSPSQKILEKSSSELLKKVEQIKNTNRENCQYEISLSTPRNIEENTFTTSYGTELKENNDPKVAKINFVNFNGYSDDSDDSDIITTSNLSISSKNCESQLHFSLPETYEIFTPNLTGPENYGDRDVEEDFDEFKTFIKTTKYIFKPNMLKKNILM